MKKEDDWTAVLEMLMLMIRIENEGESVALYRKVQQPLFPFHKLQHPHITTIN